MVSQTNSKMHLKANPIMHWKAYPRLHVKRTAVRHRGLERAFGEQLDRAAVVHFDFGELDGFVSARAECDGVHLEGEAACGRDADSEYRGKHWGG
jgi:hypothetical protein